MVEIGVEDGKTTQQLLRFCSETGTTLHGIDPLPLINEEQWKKQWGETWILHKGNSLDVLPTLPAFDAVFIDGDHNWYTVFHELQLIDRCATEHDRLPIIVLHDIDAPYGRRDLYYEPETIPAEARHPWQRCGIDVQRGTLTEHGGLNPDLCHAVHEGGPRNGVRTAIEDFLQSTRERYAFFEMHGFHGLGILVPRPVLEHQPVLKKFLDDISPSALLQAHIEHLEHDRLLHVPCAGTLDTALKEQQKLHRECTKLAGTIEHLLAETAMQQSTIERITHTRSWRWTAWIRRIESRMNRQKM